MIHYTFCDITFLVVRAAWTSKQMNRYYVLCQSRHPGYSIHIFQDILDNTYIFQDVANYKTQKVAMGCKFAFLVLLISPLLKCAHCPRCGFLGIWWNVTLANHVHFTGRHWRDKARRGLLYGRFFEVAVVHFEFRWLATAPWLHQCIPKQHGLVHIL